MLGSLFRSSAHLLGYELATDLSCFLDGTCHRLLMNPMMALAFVDFKLDLVFVLQIGANDGISNDYLNPFLASPKWSGVLVEADPSLYSLLCANNSYRKESIRCVNFAIGDGSKMPFYSVDPILAQQMPSWVKGLGGFTQSHIEKHAKDVPGLRDCVIKTMMDTVTPNALIDNELAKCQDVVITDCEGYDLAIIDMFNFAAHRPSLYVFESKHIPRKGLDFVFRTFAKYGYFVSWGGTDLIAIH